MLKNPAILLSETKISSLGDVLTIVELAAKLTGHEVRNTLASKLI